MSLQHRVKHIFNRLSTLGKLIQHYDYWFVQVQIEPAVRVVPSNLFLVVHCGHRNVTQVSIRYINIGEQVAR